MLTLITLLKKYLFLLSRIKVFLPRRNRILFYNSYILPHLDVCCIIWGNCKSTLEDKLVKFQKRAARIILDCDFYRPSKMETLKRPLNYYYYYCQPDSIFCIDLINDSVFFIDLINANFMSCL